MATALTLPFGHYCLSERSPHFLTLLQLLLIRGAMISLLVYCPHICLKITSWPWVCIFILFFSHFSLALPSIAAESRKTCSITEESVFIFAILRIDRLLFRYFSSCSLSNESLSIENYPRHVRTQSTTNVCRIRSKVIFLFHNMINWRYYFAFTANNFCAIIIYTYFSIRDQSMHLSWVIISLISLMDSTSYSLLNALVFAKSSI